MLEMEKETGDRRGRIRCHARGLTTVIVRPTILAAMIRKRRYRRVNSQRWVASSSITNSREALLDVLGPLVNAA